ncbi:hypothetical protein pb186bvf_008940 [Paramecium bursaria]
MNAVSKSKNSVPLDRCLINPQPDPINIPLPNQRVEIIRKHCQSVKRFDQPKQIPINRSELNLNKKSEPIRKTPPKSEHKLTTLNSYDRNGTPESTFQLNNPPSPKTSICHKPLIRNDEMQQLKQENVTKLQIINEQTMRMEQLCIQLENMQLQMQEQNDVLRQKEIDVRLFSEDNQKLQEENQQLYQQVEEMVRDVDLIKKGIETKEEQFNRLQDQNKQLNDEIKSLKTERTKALGTDRVNELQRELNYKYREILELQEEVQQHKTVIRNLQQDNDNYQKQYQELCEKQNKEINNKQTVSQFETDSKRHTSFQSSRSDSIMWQNAQIEQLTKEKQNCESKLIDLQHQISILTNNGNINVKEFNRLKKIVEIQRRQIESHQKTIMNQHFEIQNLQSLVYNSNDLKLSYCSNDFEQDQWYLLDKFRHHIKDKENFIPLKLKLNDDQQSFQKCAEAFLQEDTFRNIDQNSLDL